ncbi:hypothetical protein MJ1_0584 [Nanobdella aerobiophila]|uniref:Uncharacterized protein n=1 Tax=Nanobdella aerobiophila TaxID=2586965 RepID=A0A915SFZ0_9ARCH|nr:hypothetical protein MJ1_0584 [Nanobdella aerobiophila]
MLNLKDLDYYELRIRRTDYTTDIEDLEKVKVLFNN